MEERFVQIFILLFFLYRSLSLLREPASLNAARGLEERRKLPISQQTLFYFC